MEPLRLLADRSTRVSPKGQQTKAAIVGAALGLAQRVGLDGLTIGSLAELMHMSKSGVFAHFGSREELQVSVVWEYHARFRQIVFDPAMRAERGLPRLSALFENWVQHISAEIAAGCLFTSGAVEFEAQHGPVRDALSESVSTWLAALQTAVQQAVDCGHLSADCDPQLMAFKVHGLVLSLHYQSRFLQSPHAVQWAQRGFAQLLRGYAAAPIHQE